MMAGTYRDTPLIEQLGDVVRMNAAQGEGNRGATVDGNVRSDDA